MIKYGTKIDPDPPEDGDAESLAHMHCTNTNSIATGASA